MGEVYAAEDLDLGERVAIKTLRPALSSNYDLLDQFKQEIQIARKVTHRNVARVFDLFWHPLVLGHEQRLVAFLTMELLEGETLAQHVRQHGRLSERDALPIVEQILMGLSAAHAAGIIHRDLKSGNILLVEEANGVLRAAITDFGLACSQQGPNLGTGDGRLAGTLAYMAPEQLEGAPATPAGDIFSIGVVLFETITGELPFPAMGPEELLQHHLSGDPIEPQKLVPEIDSRWESVILSCLQRDPKLRPDSAEAIQRRITARRSLTRRGVLIALGSLSIIGGAARWAWPHPKKPNPEVLKSYKRGIEFARRRNEEGLRNAVDEFRRAVSLEPGYAEAWIGLADAYSAMANFNFADPRDALSKAKDAASHAVAIDHNSGTALGVLAYVTSIDVRDWRNAEPYFRKAIAVDPKQPNIRLWYGAYLGKLGRSAEAIEQIRTGLDQDPSSLILNEQLAVEYFRARRFQDFYDQARELVRLQPFEASSHLELARALEWQGRYSEALQSCDEAAKFNNSEAALCFRGITDAHQGNRSSARKIAEQVKQYWNRNPFEAIQVAILYCLLGEHAQAIDLLNAGYERGDSTILTAPTNPYFDALRSEPGYKQFLDRIGWTTSHIE